MKPRLLDLFCGAGGATRGYQLSGFHVTGVDIELQPNYCGDEFIQADALAVLRGLVDDDRHEPVGVRPLAVLGCGNGRLDPRESLSGNAVDGEGVVEAHGSSLVGNPDDSALPAPLVKPFHAIHASPPCQDYSRAMRHLSRPTARLIEPTRGLLRSVGVPWVIENVPGAPLPVQSTLTGEHGVELCGSMFGLRLRRHRLFETSLPVEAPRGCDHSRPALNAQNQAGRDRIYAEFGRQDPDPIWNEAMGVSWMGRYEAREAIPPAYTEHIGHYLRRAVEQGEVAA